MTRALALATAVQLASLALLAAPQHTAAASLVKVATPSAGALVGRTCAGGFAAAAFLGVPFAAPPLESLRFRPAQALPAVPNATIVNATTASLPCLQPSSTGDAVVGSEVSAAKTASAQANTASAQANTASTRPRSVRAREGAMPN